MGPDRELLAATTGGGAAEARALIRSGYTRSRAWRVATAQGPVLVKEAEYEGSLSMLRREAVVYRSIRGPFLPTFVGFAEGDGRAQLAIEYLEGAHWPPPYPVDVEPLFQALELVAATRSPSDLPAQGARVSRWERVAADAGPFLELGICSPGWLEGALDTLLVAEKRAVFEGTALVHNDVYAGNVGFAARGAVLVDWGAAVRGSPWVDVAFALLSVRVEGGVPPPFDFPDEGPYAAAIAGHLAAEAPLPLPDWAAPGSTLRADMIGDLRHALPWAAERLGLPLPS